VSTSVRDVDIQNVIDRLTRAADRRAQQSVSYCGASQHRDSTGTRPVSTGLPREFTCTVASQYAAGCRILCSANMLHSLSFSRAAVVLTCQSHLVDGWSEVLARDCLDGSTRSSNALKQLGPGQPWMSSNNVTCRFTLTLRSYTNSPKYSLFVRFTVAMPRSEFFF